ncbi:sarcosine oxidase subunit alpha [Marinosulfonomonas sp. PRT-SC04]|nr:sarcosine oxidase subunit alpha [Marinosulfonomonas sp. PRT-SC04]
MRVDGKGLIDRSTAVAFSFDGQRYSGHEGDTLASALLANGVRLFGRSFKYHRPRGVLTAGSEEPNALVTTGQGAQATPNVRATTQEIFTGLQAVSQNRWPSLNTDVMAVNDMFSRFLSAGFYYKTFMWPKAFWERVYEPIIRRAAGLGALSGLPDLARYDQATAHCDLLVVGAGPAGLMAALTAARAGADVILADEDARMGGRLLAETELLDGAPAHIWVDRVLAELAAMDNVRLMRRTTVTGVYDGGTYGALERVCGHLASPNADAPLETFWQIVAKQSVLAAGAIERPVAFPMNDRPGVMMASGVRSYLNRWGVATGQKVAVFGNNNDAHRTAQDLVEAGIEVVALIDSRFDADINGDYPVYTGAQVVNTKGRKALSEIHLQTSSGLEKIEADCLAMSGGWNPTLHLSCHLGGRPIWNDSVHAFVPDPKNCAGLHVAGAAAGVFSTKGALKSGVFRAKQALTALGIKAPSMPLPVAGPVTGSEDYTLSPLWAIKGNGGRAWLDFANDVTVTDVELAARENFASVEHMKRYTTQGMAPDQGKNSNIGALAVLADVTGRGIAETGTSTYRPPYVPVSIAAMGSAGAGKGFAPERFTTSHVATLARKAPMIEAGLWYRPSFFPREGEKTWRQSCDREVAMVRGSVGICDVSTLGKIDVQGPDAARFLDFIYCNMMSSLKVGRVRYGLMLRDDGFVMDDGTCARIGATHYVVTTTTAAAGLVMRHMEFVLQGLHPEWDVRIGSVTEQWAQFAVAGPKAREVLNAVLQDDIDNDSFPFMGCGAVKIGSVEARLFRISFSGEQAYEIAVPARYGAALFEVFLEEAEGLGGGAYGMEALNVLRIEKGFITHAEIHGGATAFDIGMGRMVSGKKDCIGKAASTRVGLNGPAREQLVGLKPVGAAKLMTAGAHLFGKDAEAIRENDQGGVTSVCFSPTLGVPLALGLLQNGRARHGEVIRMVDHLRGVNTLCEVCDPVFFDPDGGRVRG